MVLPEGMAEPVLSLVAHPEGLRWAEIFGRDAPVEIEIGAGKGNTLERLAGDDPGADFLGIEIGLKWVRLARARLAKADRRNARLIAGEAFWILEHHVPEGSVRRLHIYFPDPWPKKRHHKRRLFRAGLTDLLHRCLIPAGEVRIATDHADYFPEIVAVMEAGGFRADPGASWPVEPVSAFERKYREQGREIYRVVYRTGR